MAPPSPHPSLPAKPTTHRSSNSLRKTIHRKRSPSPSASASTSASEDPSTPTTKKGRYERSAAPDLLSKALASVKAETPKPSGSSTPQSAARAQFEQQEDFISFDFEEAKPVPRFTPGGGRGAGTPGTGGKRKLDEFEEKKEEGSRRVQKREKERSTPWCEEPGVEWDKCESAIAMLNKEAHAFITYISPTPIEHELRLWTVELIRRTIKSRWSDADVQCFGSVGTGLYLPGGDIDLVVLCPSFPSPPLKPTSSLLHSLASLLLTSSLAEPSSLLVIAKARVPIVKFVSRYGGFSVDLSVNQKNGVDAAVRVRGLLESYAFREEGYAEPGVAIKGKGKAQAEEDEVVDHGVARSLVLLVKAFLNQRGMNEVFTGGLGSYSIICLVVSFLQLHPKIQTGEIHPAYNVGLLFAEFLEYYGKHFNFDVTGITLRGRGGYFNKHDKGWFRPNQPYLLSIEDPNDPLNDVSGGSHNIIRVRQTLAGAFDVLAATLIHRVSHFESLRNPSIIPLSGHALPNSDYDAVNPLSQSILGSVIGMSRAGIKGREENVRLYLEGVLQSLIERSSTGTLGGTGKKAMKRLRKEEKETKKRDKTIARLDMRKEERELKQERKDKKKKALEATLAPTVASKVPLVEESSSPPPPPQVARTLFTEPSDSRYSIATSTPKANPLDIVYVGSDSDVSSEEEEDNDDDVVMGGSGGDQLVGGTSTNGKSKPPSSESDSSDAESAVRDLLVVKGAAKSKDDGVAREKKAKAEARNAFWATKGKKEIEVIELDSD